MVDMDEIKEERKPQPQKVHSKHGIHNEKRHRTRLKLSIESHM